MRRWLRRAGAVLVVIGTALACDGRTEGMPREFGPLVFGEDWRCPAVAGRYAYGAEPGGHYLAARFAPYGDTVPVEYFVLEGSADTALHVGVGMLDGRVIAKALRKGSPFSGDYYCEDGWLQLRSDFSEDRFDAEVAGEGFYPRRRKILVTANAASALVTRYDRTDYDELTVWCGDGCTGIPLPWTFETRSTWSRAEPWVEGTPRPSVTAAVRAEARAREEQERLQQDPVYRAEQAQEQGPPVVGQADARRRAVAALERGMLVLAVAPRDSGWHISLEYEAESQIPAYMVRLAQSGPTMAIRQDKLYRGRTSSGRMTGVVWVRFE